MRCACGAGAAAHLTATTLSPPPSVPGRFLRNNRAARRILGKVIPHRPTYNRSAMPLDHALLPAAVALFGGVRNSQRALLGRSSCAGSHELQGAIFAALTMGDENDLESRRTPAPDHHGTHEGSHKKGLLQLMAERKAEMVEQVAPRLSLTAYSYLG